MSELLDADITLDLIIEVEGDMREALPCDSKQHDENPVHSGPGHYWVIPLHQCYFEGPIGGMMLFCKSSIDWLIEHCPSTGRQVCFHCNRLIVWSDVLTIIGTVDS